MIIVQCVLHLLVIQTLHEVLIGTGNVDKVYHALTSKRLFKLIDCLEKSYRFAFKFNGDTELRTKLFKMGFMKQMPNLLKQETTSATNYISILLKMYADPERDDSNKEIIARLMPYACLMQ